MNQCQGKVPNYKGDQAKCYAANASVLPNGEVWCWQHNPAKIAERKRAKALAKAAPALLAGAEEAIAPWGGTPTDGSEPAWVTHLRAAVAEARKEA